MPELFLALLILVLFILLLQKLEKVEVSLLFQTLKWTLVGVLVLVAIYLVLVGRLLHVAAIVFLLILLLKQHVHRWVRKSSSQNLLPKPLSRKEAAGLLKVSEKASRKEIEEAYSRLKGKNSTEQDLFDQARKRLLKKKGRG